MKKLKYEVFSFFSSLSLNLLWYIFICYLMLHEVKKKKKALKFFIVSMNFYCSFLYNETPVLKANRS